MNVVFVGGGYGNHSYDLTRILPEFPRLHIGIY